MSQIGNIKKLSDTRFLNFYEFEAVHRDGTSAPYFVASRAKKIEQLKAISHENKPDGVILFGVYGEKKDRVVLVRQYRYPLGDYVYEFPAGLVESGEDMVAAGIREMYEETGLTFTPVDAGACSRPFFTTIGMTDESCGTVFGYCSGKPTSAHQESSEDIQVLIADRTECRRILREENVAIMCAYMLMHFVASEGDPLAFLQNGMREVPQMDVKIHPMRPDEADGKGFVHWKSWQETYTGRMPETFLARQTLEKCQDIARRWPENTLVVRLNGKIVGFSCFGTGDSGTSEVFAIYLLKEAQGLGLGRKLMDATLNCLDRRSPVTLWVLESNDPAIGFYEHYGFRMDGTQKSAPFGTECRMTYLRA